MSESGRATLAPRLPPCAQTPALLSVCVVGLVCLQLSHTLLLLFLSFHHRPLSSKSYLTGVPGVCLTMTQGNYPVSDMSRYSCVVTFRPWCCCSATRVSLRRTPGLMIVELRCIWSQGGTGHSDAMNLDYCLLFKCLTCAPTERWSTVMQPDHVLPCCY